MDLAPYVPTNLRGRVRYGRGWQAARVVLGVLLVALVVLFLAVRSWFAAAVCAAALYGVVAAYRGNVRHDRAQRRTASTSSRT